MYFMFNNMIAMYFKYNDLVIILILINLFSSLPRKMYTLTIVF